MKVLTKWFECASEEEARQMLAQKIRNWTWLSRESKEAVVRAATFERSDTRLGPIYKVTYREIGEAEGLLDAAPEWFQRDARRHGAGVNLRCPEYRKLMGEAFFRYFLVLEHCEGEAGKWRWQVRRVDQLINLIAWVKKEYR